VDRPDQSKYSRKEKNAFFLQRIEGWFLACPFCILSTMSMQLGKTMG